MDEPASFLDLVTDDAANEELAEKLAAVRQSMGYVPNYLRLFSLNRDVYNAWSTLARAISGGMDHRRYELATLGAARQLRSSYCSLAHGKALLDQYYDQQSLLNVIGDPAGSLDEADAAIMNLAAKVAEDATSVTKEDMERLRSLGLSDREILDVVLAAAARSFFSKVLDATGTLPDKVYRDLPPKIIEMLTVGRPIEA